MNRPSKIADFHPLLHCDNKFQNCFASSRSHDGCTQDCTVRLRNDLQETRDIVFAHRAIHFAHFPAMHLDTVAVLETSLFFSDPDVRDLRVRERYPRHEIAHTSRTARQQSIANSLKRLPSCVMGELVTARDIARSVDVLHVRSKMVIYRYAFLRVAHASFAQLQPVHVRSAANRDEQQVTFDLVSVSDDKDHVSMVSG